MKNIIQSLFILLFAAVLMAACVQTKEYDRSPEISGLVIPDYTDDIQGTDVTIEGKGFLPSDRLMLRPLMKPLDGSSDIEAEVREVTSSHLIFHFPEQARESGYSLLLLRGADYRFPLGTMQQTMEKGWVKDVTLRNALKGIDASVFDAQDSVKIVKAAEMIFPGNELDVSGKGVRSLDGLKYFPKLEVFRATDNNLGATDLSGCEGLTNVYLWSSQITSLKIDNPNLKVLYAGTNPYTELELTKCLSLSQLVIGGVPLHKLDISNVMCPNFIGGGDDMAFTFDTSKPGCELKISHVAYGHFNLHDAASPIRSAGLSGVKVSTYDNDGNVVIEQVDWSDGPAMAEMPDATLRGLLQAMCPAAFNGDRINVSAAKEAAITNNTLDLTGRGITSLEGLQYFPQLWYLVCDDNNLGDLDLTGYFNLTTLSAVNAGITSLKIDALPYMRNLNLSNNARLKKLDISGCTKIGSYGDFLFKATGCPLEYLDMRNAYAWVCYGTTRDKCDFSFSDDKASPRTLKVEGYWVEQWGGAANPVADAVSKGVRVEYYDWRNPPTGHYGQLQKTDN